jgi:hypothetical protein
MADGLDCEQEYDPDFADYAPSGGNLRTATFEILPDDDDYDDEDAGDDDDDEEFDEDDSDSDADKRCEDEDEEEYNKEPDDIGPRTSVKRTMSRRGAIAHHGSQYMSGTCDAAVFESLRRTDGTEEFERLPPGTQIRYHYYTSPRKRCRVTVEYQHQDPYDDSSVKPAVAPFVDEAADLMQDCRLGAEEALCRGMPRRRTDSFMSNVSHSNSSASSESFHLERLAPDRSDSFAYDRPVQDQRSPDNILVS